MLALSVPQLAVAQSDAPLSAIDWLSQSVTALPPPPAPLPPPQFAATPPKNEAPIAQSGASPNVTVTALGAPSAGPLGLLSPNMTGLPTTLWSGSAETTLVALLAAERVESLPAVLDLLRVLLLAQAEPPAGAMPQGALFLARVDKLLDMGALDPALAMLEQADTKNPVIFRRWFDVSLLTGTEDTACDVMQAQPQVAPTYPARIFCLARSGDWATAALTLNTHRVLGDVTPDEERLLTWFLDPDLADGAEPLPAPDRVSPLVFRMREAIGEGLTTQSLPLAFAHADLRETTGWKGQLEAAERLARHGAIAENALLGFYTARTPAASGGIWDRVEGVQRFDVALRARDPNAVALALPAAWDAARAAKIEVPFATLFAAQLQGLPLQGRAAELALQIGLLSPEYEAAAIGAAAGAPEFLVGVARGDLTNIRPAGPVELAIAAGFAADAPIDPVLQDMVANGQLGEALLRGIAQFNTGMAGDGMALTEALALFRHVGLEDIARRAALQALLLDRRQ